MLFRSAAQGGGTVVIPAGEFISGPLLLKSKINFHLEAGATLKAAGNYDEYPPELFIDAITAIKFLAFGATADIFDNFLTDFTNKVGINRLNDGEFWIFVVGEFLKVNFRK